MGLLSKLIYLIFKFYYLYIFSIIGEQCNAQKSSGQMYSNWPIGEYFLAVNWCLWSNCVLNFIKTK